MKPLLMRWLAGGGPLAAPAAPVRPGSAGRPLAGTPRGQVGAGNAQRTTARQLVGQPLATFGLLATRPDSLGEEAEFTGRVAAYRRGRVIVAAGHGPAPDVGKQPPAPG